MAELVVGAIIETKLFHQPELLGAVDHQQVVAGVVVEELVVAAGLVDEAG